MQSALASSLLRHHPRNKSRPYAVYATDESGVLGGIQVDGSGLVQLDGPARFDRDVYGPTGGGESGAGFYDEMLSDGEENEGGGAGSDRMSEKSRV